MHQGDPAIFPFSSICSIKTSLCFIKGLQNRCACRLSCESCLCAQCQKPGLWGKVLWWRYRKAGRAAGWHRLCVETMAGGGLCKFCATLARPEACPVLQAIPQSETYFTLALIALPLILSILPTTLTLNLPGPILEAELPGNFCLTSKMKTAYLSADSLFKMNYIKCTVQKMQE